ncbi:tryptophan-rich sensory protein [Tistrella bauzanensis]|jgi:tryptophan-rich sensory protein|uniref:TspO/MBR family protein n=1 Tax=Tistrella TaxID=171436 RepID=UPI0031F628AE
MAGSAVPARRQPPSLLSRQGLGMLIGFILLSAVVSGIGGAVTTPEIDGWYRLLPKPGFTPPDWLFAPVWSALYLMMAVAAWRVWRASGLGHARGALRLHLAQLALNLAWSVLFFGLHLTGAALIDILLLLIAIVLTTRAFMAHDRIAGLLMLPYIAWVGYATALNTGIWLSMP